MDLLRGKDQGLDPRALAVALLWEAGFSLGVHPRLLRLSKEVPVPLGMEAEDDPYVRGTAPQVRAVLS